MARQTNAAYWAQRMKYMEDALRDMEGESRAQYAGAARMAMEIAAGKLGG